MTGVVRKKVIFPVTHVQLHSKNKTPVLENAIAVLAVKLKRGSTNFGNFSR